MTVNLIYLRSNGLIQRAKAARRKKELEQSFELVAFQKLFGKH